MDNASEVILSLKTGHVPLQERLDQEHTAIWVDGRRSGKGESGFGAARQRR